LQALPANSAEARAIGRLCSMMSEFGDSVPEYAILLERWRGSDEESVLRSAAAELMRQPFAEEDIDAEFEGALSRLREGERKRDFAQLQEKVARLGVTGLSSEEKAHYLRMLDRLV
ncbi:MAG: DNA primase, partial [Candidatus Accumulibacter sp.]|jgi:DNA primase|nr:DNA primase [Accumulibacter sp.]